MLLQVLNLVPFKSETLPPAVGPMTVRGHAPQVMADGSPRFGPSVMARQHFVHEDSHRLDARRVHQSTLLRGEAPRVLENCSYSSPKSDQGLIHTSQVGRRVSNSFERRQGTQGISNAVLDHF